MTKQLFKSLIDSAYDGNTLDWLYTHQEELDKDEVCLIARELAYACQDPLDPNGELTRKDIADAFNVSMTDYYDTYGFDDEEE